METKGEGPGGVAPSRDFGHLVVVLVVELLQQRGGFCSNFAEFSLFRICMSCASSCFRMVGMASFCSLLVAMRGFYEL